MTAPDLRAAAQALERAGVTGFRNLAEGIDILARHRDSHCADADRLAKRVEELKAAPQGDPAPAERELRPNGLLQQMRAVRVFLEVFGSDSKNIAGLLEHFDSLLVLVDHQAGDPAPPAAASKHQPLTAARKAWPPMSTGQRDGEPERGTLQWLAWFCGMVWQWAHYVPPGDARLACEIADMLVKADHSPDAGKKVDAPDQPSRGGRRTRICANSGRSARSATGRTRSSRGS